MIDYYVYRLVSGLQGTLKLTFLLSTTEIGVALHVLEREFQKKRSIDGAIGIDRTTQAQVFHRQNLRPTNA